MNSCKENKVLNDRRMVRTNCLWLGCLDEVEQRDWYTGMIVKNTKGLKVKSRSLGKSIFLVLWSDIFF